MAQKLNWLRNAFGVSAAPAPPTAQQQLLLQRVSQEVVRRRLTTPALAFLEMSRPVNFLGAQAMHFFTPLMSVVFDPEACREFGLFLERRDAIDLWCEEIEKQEQLASQANSSSPPEAPDQADAP